MFAHILCFSGMVFLYWRTFIRLNFRIVQLTIMVTKNLDKESICGFRSFVRIGDRHWEWCSLYNTETSKLDCDICEYSRLYRKPIELRKEIIS